MEKRYLTRKEAAEYVKEKGLPCAPSSLCTWATTGGGPNFRKFGRNVVYLPEELDVWIDSRLSGPKASTCDSGHSRVRAV